eukprot:10991267-Ditylum_brightwellii.AAC.1
MEYAFKAASSSSSSSSSLTGVSVRDSNSFIVIIQKNPLPTNGAILHNRYPLHQFQNQHIGDRPHSRLSFTSPMRLLQSQQLLLKVELQNSGVCAGQVHYRHCTGVHTGHFHAIAGNDDNQGLQIFKVDCAGHYLPLHVVASRANDQEMVNFLKKKVDDMKGYDLDQTVRALARKCKRVPSSWSWEGMVHWVKLSFSAGGIYGTARKENACIVTKLYIE